jgi:hypothetical protein
MKVVLALDSWLLALSAIKKAPRRRLPVAGPLTKKSFTNQQIPIV